MPTFSQRMGLAPMTTAFQRDSMDEKLRTHLWNSIFMCIEQRMDIDESALLIRGAWIFFFDRTVDRYQGHTHAVDTCRALFFSGEWNEVYEFLEFFLARVRLNLRDALRDSLNNVLERQNSAYRVVDLLFVPITDQNEISTVEEAISTDLTPVTTHLAAALRKLSSRDQPDYRNSVKESILAVESCCRTIVGDQKATLGAALTELAKVHPIHPAMKSAMSQLYGYASDGGGIRHALTEGDRTPDFAEAKYMLVVCAAFCNFVTLRNASSAGDETGQAARDS